MGKFKVHFKLMEQQTDEISEVHKLIVSHADTLEDISGKIENDETLAAIKNNLKSGSTQLRDFAQGMSAMIEMVNMCLEMYKSTENESVSKVDETRAHNRDFYKRPVSVPSPGGVDSAGAAAADMPTTVSIESTTIRQTNTYVQTQMNPSSTPAATPQQVASTVSSYQPAADTKPDAGGIGAGAVAGIAAGAAASAAGGIGVGVMAKKKKAAQGQADAEDPANEEFDTAEA